MKILTADEMRTVDRVTTERFGVATLVLMENAGAAVARFVLREFPDRRQICVLCGKGNNGGDGFVVAAKLAQSGWPVRVALLGSIEAMGADAQHHARRWQGNVEPLAPGMIENAELVVVALFGSGLSRHLTAQVAGLLAYASRRGIPLIAVDIPSGIAGDSGENWGCRLRFELAQDWTDPWTVCHDVGKNLWNHES